MGLVLQKSIASISILRCVILEIRSFGPIQVEQYEKHAHTINYRSGFTIITGKVKKSKFDPVKGPGQTINPSRFQRLPGQLKNSPQKEMKMTQTSSVFTLVQVRTWIIADSGKSALFQWNKDYVKECSKLQIPYIHDQGQRY